MSKVINRWQAFFIHLSLSLFIFLAILALIGLVWYPNLFIYIGGLQGIKIVAGVDMVLGPLLTLIVFNPKKKSIKWDLTAIATVQVSCLTAGVWLVYGQHPIVQVLSNDGVYTFTYHDLSRLKNFDKIKAIDGYYPKKVFLVLPDTSSEIAMIKYTQGLVEGNSVEERIDLYRSFEEIPQSELNTRLVDYKFDSTHDCYWMPLYSSQYAGNACFSIKSGIVALLSQTEVRNKR